MMLGNLFSLLGASSIWRVRVKALALPPGPSDEFAEPATRLQDCGAIPFVVSHARIALLSARWAAWACIMLITILSLVPGAARPQSGLPGRIEHFIAYAGAGLLWDCAFLCSRQRILGWIGLALASGVFEVLQNFVPGRSPSCLDALASTAGLTFGMILGAALTAALIPEPV